jgi:hypothetical protein
MVSNNLYSQSSDFPTSPNQKKSTKINQRRFPRVSSWRIVGGSLDLYSSLKQMGTLHHVASRSSANEKKYYTTMLSQL